MVKKRRQSFSFSDENYKTLRDMSKVKGQTKAEIFFFQFSLYTYI